MDNEYGRHHRHTLIIPEATLKANTSPQPKSWLRQNEHERPDDPYSGISSRHWVGALRNSQVKGTGQEFNTLIHPNYEKQVLADVIAINAGGVPPLTALDPNSMIPSVNRVMQLGNPVYRVGPRYYGVHLSGKPDVKPVLYPIEGPGLLLIEGKNSFRSLRWYLQHQAALELAGNDRAKAKADKTLVVRR